MAENNPEKEAALQEAEERTIEEKSRLESYRSLRFDYTPYRVRKWINGIYERERPSYAPVKDPSRGQIRSKAGVRFTDRIVAIVKKDKRKEVERKLTEAKKELQAEVDATNKVIRERAQEAENRLSQKLDEKKKKLSEADQEAVETYFSEVMRSDSYALGETRYDSQFWLSYAPHGKRLIIDYQLPATADISRTIGWKVGKGNDLQPQKMGEKDYYELYERILFDLSFRVIGLLFDSDELNVLCEIAFNGICRYGEWQRQPSVLLSFIMQKSKYPAERLQRMDFVSKKEIAKLKQCAYVDNLHSDKPPLSFKEEPPTKVVTPFQSNL